MIPQYIVYHQQLDAGVANGLKDIDFRGTKEQCGAWLNKKVDQGDKTNYQMKESAFTETERIITELENAFK